MKKYIIFLLILLIASGILQGCSREANKIDITPENYPRIDGSTSALPIIQGMYKAFFEPEIIDGEITEKWAGLPHVVSQTIESYRKLIDGEIDLIIVPDPSEEVQKLAEEQNAELEYIPICLEALVFITHKDNSAENITTEEIKSIYTDRKINLNYWLYLESGGPEKRISPLSRNEDSGSHALMEKFILKGEKINEHIEMNNMMMTMFAIVDYVEDYVNRVTHSTFMPLGYTLYYFLQNNKEEHKWDNVKMLNIDGVEPNNQTIASGEYPYSTNYYAVIKSGMPEDSPARALISWLLSDDGQKMISDAGFGNINIE